MLKQLGKYKEKVLSILRSSDNIRSILLEGLNMQDLTEDTEIKKRTLPYLFTDGCVSDISAYIFVDISISKAEASTKLCTITVQTLCHKDDYKYESAGFTGGKADILADMIYQELIEKREISNSFGIGSLRLDKTETIHTEKYFGHSLTFTVPDFK